MGFKEDEEKDEDLYLETYAEASEAAGNIVPKVKAVLDVISWTLDNNPEVFCEFTRLLEDASGVVGVYVKEIVSAAYRGRAEGIVDSYNIFENKFGSEVALELIKQIR